MYPSSGAFEKQLRRWDCRNRIVLFADTNFFTDREASNVVNPSELDLVYGLALRYDKAELAVIHEKDFPLDRTGLVQRYVTIQLRYEFEWSKSSSTPSTARASRHQEHQPSPHRNSRVKIPLQQIDIVGPPSRSLMTSHSTTDEHWMRVALEEATKAPLAGEIPIGAVIVRDGEMVAKAHNYRELWQDPTAHAEIVAIRAAASALGSWRLTDTTLYVTVEPCAMCIGAIILARVPRLVFGARDPKAGACGSVFDLSAEARLNHRVLVTEGVLNKECQALLQHFFRRLRTEEVQPNSPLP